MALSHATRSPRMSLSSWMTTIFDMDRSGTRLFAADCAVSSLHRPGTARRFPTSGRALHLKAEHLVPQDLDVKRRRSSDLRHLVPLQGAATLPWLVRSIIATTRLHGTIPL
jgi:hypothetical protein